MKDATIARQVRGLARESRQTTGLEDALDAGCSSTAYEISRWSCPGRCHINVMMTGFFHFGFPTPQPWSEFAHTANSCSGSRPPIIFSLLDVTRLFLAVSSSVRSNTSNAVALSIRDSLREIVIDCTPQGKLSTISLSTNPFKFLSRLNAPAVNVFVPRSAHMSFDFVI